MARKRVQYSSVSDTSIDENLSPQLLVDLIRASQILFGGRHMKSYWPCCWLWYGNGYSVWPPAVPATPLPPPLPTTNPPLLLLAEEKPVTLKIWFHGSTVTPDASEKVMESVNAYLKDKINATIEPIWGTWGDFDQATVTASGWRRQGRYVLHLQLVR